jgi:threonyl-tRNA synthetase
MELDNEKYYLKAMNCPHHHKIFGATPKSYRDLPARYAEYGHCYRYEDSGSLFGLMRVRSLCMNDAHIYCTPEQFEEEFTKVIEMYMLYFKVFGIDKYQMRLSKYSKDGLGKKYVDNEALWIQTEDQVRQALVKS